MLTMEQRLKMLEPPADSADMVLDTDAYNEIDDQFAISYAMMVPEKLHLKALYAAPFHNRRSVSPADGMEKSYQEILKLLKLAGKNYPVHRGSTTYLPDETTPVSSSAAEDLAERAMGYTPEAPLYAVAISAITNVASALLLRPEIADRMVVVWLGGHALTWHDNLEFNMRQDVAAARVVFNSGVPLVILPCMGVVSGFTVSGPELVHWLQGKNALCNYLVQQTCEEAESYAAGRVWSRVVWDVTAVGWLLNAQGRFMSSQLTPTPVPAYDHHYGFDPRRPLCRYVYYIKRDALLDDLFCRLAKSDPFRVR